MRAHEGHEDVRGPKTSAGKVTSKETTTATATTATAATNNNNNDNINYHP
jgi:hypothetical protein